MSTFDELVAQDHRCPECGKIMLLEMSNMVLDSDPPQTPCEWRCGCGYRRFAGNWRPHRETEEENFMRRWEAVNR